MEKIRGMIQKAIDASFASGRSSSNEAVINAVKARNELIDGIEKLVEGLFAVESLIGESKGVAGYHKNGDVATWEELRTGGRCDALTEFDEALRVLE